MFRRLFFHRLAPEEDGGVANTAPKISVSTQKAAFLCSASTLTHRTYTRNQASMVGARHDVHSHAHEEGVPGTVNLQAREGEETHYGQALYPVPSSDPNDPLQVCEQLPTATPLTLLNSGQHGRKMPSWPSAPYTRSWVTQLSLDHRSISASTLSSSAWTQTQLQD